MSNETLLKIAREGSYEKLMDLLWHDSDDLSAGMDDCDSPDVLVPTKSTASQVIDVNCCDDLQQTPLILAVIRDDLGDKKSAFIKEILNQKPNLHWQSYPWGTALTAAAYLEDWDTVKSLIWAELLQSKKITFEPDKHPTAFNWVISGGNEELVEKFIREGASLDDDGSANWKDHPDWLWTELSGEACPFTSDSSRPRFDLPLNIAVRAGHTKIVRLLIVAGACKQKKGYRDKSAEDLLNYSLLKEKLEEAMTKPGPDVLVGNDVYKEEIKNLLKEMLTGSFLEVLQYFENVQKGAIGQFVALLNDVEKYTPDIYIGQCHAIFQRYLPDKKSESYSGNVYGQMVRMGFYLCPKYSEERDSVMAHEYNFIANNLVKRVLRQGSTEEDSHKIVLDFLKSGKEHLAQEVKAFEDERSEVDFPSEKFFLPKVLDVTGAVAAWQRLSKPANDTENDEAIARDLRDSDTTVDGNVVVGARPPAFEAALRTPSGMQRDEVKLIKIMQTLILYKSTNMTWKKLLRPGFPSYSSIYYHKRLWEMGGNFDKIKEWVETLSSTQSLLKGETILSKPPKPVFTPPGALKKMSFFPPSDDNTAQKGGASENIRCVTPSSSITENAQ